DKVVEFVFELGDELGIVAETGIRGVELIQRMHQGFGHECAAVGAKMPFGIREVVSCHGVSQAASKRRTSWANCCIFTALFRPGSVSTPLLTSTAYGRTSARAWRTFAACNPPDKTSGRASALWAMEESRDQSKLLPLPPKPAE